MATSLRRREADALHALEQAALALRRGPDRVPHRLHESRATHHAQGEVMDAKHGLAGAAAMTKGQRIRRAPARLEKYEQADGVKLLKSLGAAVYVLGTHRRAGDYQGTMQTPGIADVEAWLPVKGQPGARKLLKFEVKRARGARLSPEQAAYRQHCEDAGVDYVCGDLSALMRWLVAAGYLRRDQVPAERLRDDV